MSIKIIYKNATYFLPNPEDYGFFDPILKNKVDVVELELYEDVMKKMCEGTVQISFDELYVSRDLQGIKKLKSGLNYFFSKKPIDKLTIYKKRKNEIIMNHVEKNPEKIYCDLCYNKSLPIEFWEKYIDCIDWNYLCENPSLPVEFWEKYIDCINWYYLCSNPSLPVEFWEKYIDWFNLKFLCENPSLPVEFWEKYIDRVEWGALCRNNSLPVEFWEKYIDRVEWGA